MPLPPKHAPNKNDMLETIAILVGVSKFQDKELCVDLPGAGRDVFWVKSVLKANQIELNKCIVLVAEDATKAKIQATINETLMSRSVNSVRLLLFVSTHGQQSIGVNGSDVSLHCFDTSSADFTETSIQLGRVIAEILSADSCKEVLVFIDACTAFSRQSISALLNANDERLKASTFCCFIANPFGVALERITTAQGAFTSIVCDAIDSVAINGVGSIAKFSDRVNSLSNKHGIPEPFFFGSGNMSIRPFRPTEDWKVATEVYRKPVVTEIIRLLRNSTHEMGVQLVGKSGSGKSTILKQIALALDSAPLITISNHQAERDPKALVYDIAVSAVSQTTGIPCFIEDSETAISDTFRQIADCGSPILLLDGGEHLSEHAWKLLVDNCKGAGLLLLVTGWNKRSQEGDWIVFSVPMLSRTDASLVAAKRGFSDEDLINRAFDQSAGNPMEFLAGLQGLLDSGFTIPTDLLPTVQCVLHSRGYIDVDLFASTFEVGRGDLKRLYELGLVIAYRGYFELHDSAIHAVPPTHNSEILEKSIFYWRAEFEGNRSKLAARKIIDIVLFEDKLITAEALTPDIVFAAEPDLDLTTLMAIVQSSIKHDHLELFGIAADVLSRRGHLPALQDVCLFASNYNAQTNSKPLPSVAKLAMARAFWWQGDYASSRLHANEAIATSNDLSVSLRAKLEIAICDFFEGKWDEAKIILEELLSRQLVDSRVIGWGKLILGTIVGIRGEDVDGGRKLLHQAETLLRNSRDLAGVAIALNNCGEVSWKSGLFRESEQELHTGLATAKSLGMTVNTIESRRNLLQLYLRMYGPHHPSISLHEEELRKSSVSSIGEMEMMQVANTLATLFLRRQSFKEATCWIEIAIPLTRHNAEYDIYTKANQAILIAATAERNWGIEATIYLEHALRLCVSGKNLFAIKQIREDIIGCLAKAQPRRCGLLLDVFDRIKGTSD
jgi:hypothetical protein